VTKEEKSEAVPAVNLGPKVNTADNDNGPEISPDGGLLYFSSNRPGGFGLEDLYAVAVAYDGTTQYYVVNDAATDQMYRYSANGPSLATTNLGSGNTAPRGAASNFVGDKLWVADANKTVYVYNPSGSLLGSWTAGSLAPNAEVEGVATNGADI
jgi:hypothetical protein